LLSQLYGDTYYNLIKELSKNVKSKQQTLKYYKENPGTPDPALIKPINLNIFSLSRKIWIYRNMFFLELQKRLPIYSSWINSPIKEWSVDYQIVNLQGQRLNYFEALQSMSLKNEPLNDDSSITIDRSETAEIQPEELSAIWEKELITGKVLFGAQRDDFFLKSHNLLAENILSKGETRLLVLFIKHIAIQLLKTPSINPYGNKVWWFLDDVYNEFDKQREREIFQSILGDVSYHISTATHIPAYAASVYSLKDLTKEK
jgi:recombinational DNA repair ATPase RecF